MSAHEGQVPPKHAEDSKLLKTERIREDIRGMLRFHYRPSEFQNIRSIDVLHFLRQDKSEFSLICRIELRDSSASIKQAMMNNQGANAQILERESSGAYVLFIKGRARKHYAGTSLLRNIRGYLVSVELNDKRIRTTYIGKKDSSPLRERAF